ncbi:hypothetical protein IJM86_08685 [bacterium]|nr:hypothetical protein [bacterium]
MESNELSKIIKIKPIKNKYAVYVEENIEGNIKPVLITTDFKEIFKNRSNTTDPIGRKDIEDFKNYCYTKIEGYKTVRTQEREVRESIYNQELMQNFNTYLFSE